MKTAIFSLMLLSVCLPIAACFQRDYSFPDSPERVHQPPPPQLEMVQKQTLGEVAYTEPSKQLIFQRDDIGSGDTLEESSWTLDSMSDSRTVVPSWFGSGVTMEIMDGGKLKGSAGCTKYSSNDYSAAGGIFNAGTISFTTDACPEPSAKVVEQEAKFLELLDQAEFYNILSNVLTLTVPAKDYVLRPSIDENHLMVIRTRMVNHRTTRIQLDLEAFPAELRMNTGRYDSINIDELRMPAGELHVDKNIYWPLIRSSQVIEGDSEMEGWLIFDVPKGSVAESLLLVAGDVIIVNL